jgi:N-acetylglucosamine kinase-like BadF-type ATPase
VSYQNKKLVIGIDGGGTKTHGILFTEDGQTLASGHFPSSNPHSNPREEVIASLHGLVDHLIENSEVTLEQVDGVCMGMAGCDRPHDRALLTEIMEQKIGKEKPLIIVNDAMVAMMAVLERLHGILVIGGTGSICLGYHEKKGRARCGGWGHLLADEGSGYLIGLEALKAIMGEFDQRTQKTSLTDRILKELKLDIPTDLIAWTYLDGNGKTEIANLSRIVEEEAEKGDLVAKQIQESQADLLVELVITVYNRLFSPNEEAPLALWGGNLMNNKSFREHFIKQIKATGLNMVPVVKDVEAVEGAAVYMLQQL